jgi:hypothetical protein
MLAITCIIYYFTVVINESLILEPIRESISNLHPKLDYLIHCFQCTSFWVAIILYLFIGDFLMCFGALGLANIIKDTYNVASKAITKQRY